MAEPRNAGRWQFWIDRGGTFTDIVARRPDGSIATHKLLSENPGRYRDAALAGIRKILNLNEGQPIPAGAVDAGKRSEEHTSELPSQSKILCRLLLVKKKKHQY